MAFSVNKVTLVGGVTRDPELKYTNNNNPICNISMATNRSVKDGNGYKDVPTYHNVKVFGKFAEWIANNIQKGSKIYVDGRVENRTYTDKNGNNRFTSEIIADNIIPFTKGEKKRSDYDDEDLDAGYGGDEDVDFSQFVDNSGKAEEDPFANA